MGELAVILGVISSISEIFNVVMIAYIVFHILYGIMFGGPNEEDLD